MFEGQLSASACNQSCSSAGREPLQQRAQGDDDDHDACDDEFSSCGQLDPSAEKDGGGEKERGGGGKGDFIEEEWKNGP